jgi:hypothetical protein
MYCSYGSILDLLVTNHLNFSHEALAQVDGVPQAHYCVFASDEAAMLAFEEAKTAGTLQKAVKTGTRQTLAPVNEASIPGLRGMSSCCPFHLTEVLTIHRSGRSPEYPRGRILCLASRTRGWHLSVRVV